MLTYEKMSGKDIRPGDYVILHLTPYEIEVMYVESLSVSNDLDFRYSADGPQRYMNNLYDDEFTTGSRYRNYYAIWKHSSYKVIRFPD